MEEQQLIPSQAKTDGPSGGNETLASSASDKTRAATFMEKHLLPDTQAAGRMGEGGGQVHPPMMGPGGPQSVFLKPDTGLKGLSAWAAESGLSEAMTVWQGQVDRLVGRLHHELNGLQGTKSVLQGQDHAAGAQFGLPNGTLRPASSFDKW
ncbi:hypothetical protein [Streptomyces violascens]|uniref:hypothetical protein n=1 Tax=Streptomyces violascens TaxID=67381 RepID=UPI0036638D1F